MHRSGRIGQRSASGADRTTKRHFPGHPARVRPRGTSRSWRRCRPGRFSRDVAPRARTSAASAETRHVKEERQAASSVGSRARARGRATEGRPRWSRIAASNAEHPLHAAVVKELYGSGATVVGWAVAVKTKAASDGGNGWYWYHAGAREGLHCRCSRNCPHLCGARGPLADVSQGFGSLLLIEDGPKVRIAASVTGPSKDACGHAPGGSSCASGLAEVSAANQRDERGAATTYLQRDGEGRADPGAAGRTGPDGGRGQLRPDGFRCGREVCGETRGCRGEKGGTAAEAAKFVSGPGPEPGRCSPPQAAPGLPRYPG